MQWADRLPHQVRAVLQAPARRITLRGRSAFITGGSRGLGLEIAREFGRRGARVAIFARDAAESERALADLAGRQIEAIAIAGDVRSRDDLVRGIAETRARFGTIDILVNNAGIIGIGPMDAQTEADYREAMDTHFWGAFHAIEAVVPDMRARRDGRIVNVSSVGGRLSVPHLLPYSASKFALAGYSEGLRAELVRDRVYVTTVIPGLMRTGSPENAEFKARHRAEYTWFSIADSLPFLSVDVTTAAREIADATERGDAVVTISLLAKIAAIVHGAFPSFVCEANGILAHLLPRNGGIGSAKRRGKDSHSAVSPSLLTTAGRRRADTQNEVVS